MPVIEILLSKVTNWETFAEALGFPALYGANMNAWIDFLTYVDEDDGMSSVTVDPGDVLTLALTDFKTFRRRIPDVAEALLDSAAFVNFRRIEAGDRSILALSYWD